AKSGLVRFEQGRGTQVWEADLEFGNELSDVGNAGAHVRKEHSRFEALGVEANGLHPGPVRRCAALVVTPAPEDCRTLLCGNLCDLLRETRFPDARVPCEHNQA